MTELRDAREIAAEICGCASREQRKRDVAIITADRAAVRAAAMLEGARLMQEAAVRLGCPTCSGDCGSANPPVLNCWMHNLQDLDPAQIIKDKRND